MSSFCSDEGVQLKLEGRLGSATTRAIVRVVELGEELCESWRRSYSASVERREATVESYRPLPISECNGKKFVAFVGRLIFPRPTLQYIYIYILSVVRATPSARYRAAYSLSRVKFSARQPFLAAICREFGCRV